MISKVAARFAPVMLLACATGAQASGVVLEANGARAESRWGGELGAGYAFDIGRVRIRPIGGVFIHQGDNDRYRRETFSNGQSRCRDGDTGRFASDANCINVAARWYAKAELAYAFPSGVEFGGGARFSNDRVRPYGSLAFGRGPARFKANVGDRYYAAGVMFRL